MRAIVKKWGNSAAVRIPSGILKTVGLGVDDEVDVSEREGRIVITPRRGETLDLARLLNEITPGNLHSAADFGAPLGKESL